MRFWILMLCFAVCACDDGDDPEPYPDGRDCGCVDDMMPEPDAPPSPAPCDDEVRLDLADEPNWQTTLDVVSTDAGRNEVENPPALCSQDTHVLHFTAPENGQYLFRGRGEGAFAIGARLDCNEPEAECTSAGSVRRAMQAGELAEVRVRAYDDFDADVSPWEGPLSVSVVKDVVATVSRAEVRVWPTGYVMTVFGTSADRDEVLEGTLQLLDATGDVVADLVWFGDGVTYVDDAFRSTVGDELVPGGPAVTQYRLTVGETVLEGDVEAVAQPGVGEPCYRQNFDTVCAADLVCGASGSVCPADNPACSHDWLCGRASRCLPGEASETFPADADSFMGVLPADPSGIEVSCGAGFGQIVSFMAPQTAMYTFELRTEGWTGVLATLTCASLGAEVSCGQTDALHLVEGTWIELRVDAALGEAPGAYTIEVSRTAW
jgi:hypothetical protein